VENVKARRSWLILLALGVLFAIVGYEMGFLHLSAASPTTSSDRAKAYLYEDTRRLVSLVEDAADGMERNGESMFDAFRVKGSPWFDDKNYLFIYDLDGKCVFHPVAPELIGHNLMTLHDVNGKPLVRWITDIGRRPDAHASDWVFYLWVEGTQLDPSWKSSYVRKVVCPNGKTYVIGCGSSTLKIEKSWVKDRVDAAAAQVAARADAETFRTLSDPASPFTFLGTYIFVMTMDGRSVVDPSYPTLQGRDLTRFRDITGRDVIGDIQQQLKDKDFAWVQYMSAKPGEALPARKLAYVRKVISGGKTYIVGSDYFIATPIWMRL